MKLYRFGCFLCAVTFAAVSCNCTVVHLGGSENANAHPSATTSSSPLNQNKSKSDEIVYSLDLDKREIEQPIEPGDMANAKFVQVEVTQVTNPQNRPARFQVHYQPKEGEKILLGAFSLFPPNNPGKFIVPTQGKLKGEGKLILSLVKSDKAVAGDLVRVRVKKLKFVNDIDR